MSRQKAAPIDPELWELHKADILRLYITKNNTLPVIRDRMRDEFGFTAS